MSTCSEDFSTTISRPLIEQNRRKSKGPVKRIYLPIPIGHSKTAHMRTNGLRITMANRISGQMRNRGSHKLNLVFLLRIRIRKRDGGKIIATTS